VFGIGGNELLIIAVFVLIIFGPDKLPQLARTFGQAVKMFKKAQADMEHVIRTEMYTTADKPASVTENAEKLTATPATPTGVDAASIWSATDQDDDEEAEEEE